MLKLLGILIILYYLSLLKNAAAEDVTVAITTRRFLHRTDEKFISIVIDPLLLTSNFDTSSQTLTLARHLAPAFLRIHGPSTRRVTFADDGVDQLGLTVRPLQWASLNTWIAKTNLTPVFALSDRDRVNDAWDPHSVALPLMQLSDQLNVTCYWELTNETPNKTVRQCVEDVTALHHILDAFPGSRAAWGTVAGEMSRCALTESPDNVRKLLIRTANNVQAINWAPKYTKMSDFPPKLPKLFSSQYIPVWTTAPRSTRPSSFRDALQWARNLGEAAASGYSVVFRQPRLQELTAATPAYWVTLLHKRLMGRTVLGVRQPMSSSVYAHCANQQNRFIRRGALSILVVNTGHEALNTFLKYNAVQQRSLEIQSYILTTTDEESSDVYLNGEQLNASALYDEKVNFVPKIRRAHLKRGLQLSVPARSLAFFVLPGVGIPACVYAEDDTNLVRAEIFEDQKNEFSISSSSSSDDDNEEEATEKDFELSERDDEFSVRKQLEQKTNSPEAANWATEQRLVTALPSDVRQLIIERAKLLEKQKRAFAHEQRRADLKQLLLERSKIEKAKWDTRTSIQSERELNLSAAQQTTSDTNTADEQPVNLPTRQQTNAQLTTNNNDNSDVPTQEHSKLFEFQPAEDEDTNRKVYNEQQMSKIKTRKTNVGDLSPFNNEHLSTVYRNKRELQQSFNELLPQISLTETGREHDDPTEIISLVNRRKNGVERVDKHTDIIEAPFDESIAVFNFIEKNYQPSSTAVHEGVLAHSKPRKLAMLDETSNDIQSDEYLPDEKYYRNNFKELPHVSSKKRALLKSTALKSSNADKYRQVQNKSKESRHEQRIKETEESGTNKNIDIETTPRQNELSKNRAKRNLSNRIMEIRQGRHNFRERLRPGHMIKRVNNQRPKNAIMPTKKLGSLRIKRRTQDATSVESNDYYNEAEVAEELTASESYTTDINKLDTSVFKPKTKKSKSQIKLLQHKLQKQRKVEERLENYLKKIKDITQEISNEIHENESNHVRVRRNIRQNYMGNDIEKGEAFDTGLEQIDDVLAEIDNNRFPVEDNKVLTSSTEYNDAINPLNKQDAYNNAISKENKFSNNMNDLDDDPYKVKVSVLKPKNKQKTNGFVHDYGGEAADYTHKIVASASSSTEHTERYIDEGGDGDHFSGASVFEGPSAEDSLSGETVYEVENTVPGVSLVDNVFQVVFNFLSDFHKRILHFIGYER